jgi:hypothetical protein
VLEGGAWSFDQRFLGAARLIVVCCSSSVVCSALVVLKVPKGSNHSCEVEKKLIEGFPFHGRNSDSDSDFRSKGPQKSRSLDPVQILKSEFRF